MQQIISMGQMIIQPNQFFAIYLYFDAITQKYYLFQLGRFRQITQKTKTN